LFFAAFRHLKPPEEKEASAGAEKSNGRRGDARGLWKTTRNISRLAQSPARTLQQALEPGQEVDL